MLENAIRPQPPKPFRRDRLEPWTFPLLEPDGLAEGVGDDEDVGEQDRRVELEPPERLQRYLSGELRIVAEIEEASPTFSRMARYSGR